MRRTRQAAHAEPARWPARKILAAPTLVVLALLFLYALPAAANWSPLPGGVPICTDGSVQQNPQPCPDGSGGVIVAWMDWRGGAAQIYAQRFNVAGAAQWAANGVRLAPSGSGQGELVIASDGGGGAIIAWQENRSGHCCIYAQRITSAGAVAPGWPASGFGVITVGPNDSGNPVIISDGAGGAIVAGTYVYSSSDYDIYANRITAAGTIAAGWAAAGMPIATPSFIQTNPHIASDGAGGAFISWDDSRANGGAGADIWASHVLSNGSIASGWGLSGSPVCSDPGVQLFNMIASDGAGGAIIAWEDERNGTNAIYAQRMSSGAAAQWAADGVQIANGGTTEQFPDIVGDGSGGALMAWITTPSSQGFVYAQHVASDGGVAVGWPPNGILLCTTARDRYLNVSPAVAADGSGGMFVAWGDARNADIDIYAQHLTGSGQTAWLAADLALCTAAGQQNFPHLTSDGAGNVFCTWDDYRWGESDPDIYGVLATGLSNLRTGFTLPGWSGPVVPRRDATATGNSCVVSPTLDGNTSDTYLNWVFSQDGPNPVPPFTNEVWLDEDASGAGGYWPFGDGTVASMYLTGNVGPTSVRGGRHSLTCVTDVGTGIPESTESDDIWRGQWVWSPLAVTRNAPNVRAAPPLRGYLAQFNSDGFAFTRPDTRFAWVVSLAPLNSGDDYDLYVYDDYFGSTSGFSNLRGYSEYSGNSTDFVVGHFSSTPATFYPAAIFYNAGGGGGSYALDQSDAQGRNFSGAAQYFQQSLPAYRLADVYEAYFTAGQKYYVVVSLDAGGSDLACAVFSPAVGGVYDRNHAKRWSAPETGAVDTLTLAADTTGWYPIVVYRTSGAGLSGPVTYNLFAGAGTAAVVNDVAHALSFEGALPNPIRGAEGRMIFSLSQAGQARLELFDLQGRRVRLLLGQFPSGRQEVPWNLRSEDGSLLASGVYFARLSAEGRTLTRRVVVLK